MVFNMLKVLLWKKSELALANAQFQFIKQNIIHMKHTRGLLTSYFHSPVYQLTGLQGDFTDR